MCGYFVLLFFLSENYICLEGHRSKEPIKLIDVSIKANNRWQEECVNEGFQIKPCHRRWSSIIILTLTVVIIEVNHHIKMWVKGKSDENLREMGGIASVELVGSVPASLLFMIHQRRVLDGHCEDAKSCD